MIYFIKEFDDTVCLVGVTYDGQKIGKRTFTGQDAEVVSKARGLTANFRLGLLFMMHNGWLVVINPSWGVVHLRSLDIGEVDVLKADNVRISMNDDIPQK